MLMRFLIVFFLLLAFREAESAEFFQPWQPQSSPVKMVKNLERRFDQLPLKGKVKDLKKFWSSDYWPLFKGNINSRWNTPKPIGFKLNSPDKILALKMNQSELAQLAPSEKFDLFSGRYDYPLRKEVEKRVSPRRKEWEGICHGWAAAAMNHIEPIPRIMTNPDGIQVPFGSSDIKALLSYYYAYHYHPVSTHQMGRRCKRGSARYCQQDLNAGAFHLVLTNLVGREGESFIADIDNGREVWNQVVFDYSSEMIQSDLPPSRDSAAHTSRVVRLKTKMRVVFNIVSNSWLPANGTPLQTFEMREYEYDLDLSSEGHILGGKWLSKVRPDFLWKADRIEKFSSKFEKLKRLILDMSK